MQLPPLKYYLVLAFISMSTALLGQDTFSIVALDSTSKQVGSAGATCIAIDTLSRLINRVVPGKGVINAQARSSVPNLELGKNYIVSGVQSQNVIDSLYTYDKDGLPETRQNLVATFDKNGSPSVRSFTGSSTQSYAGSQNGTNFTVAGNILSGKSILDSMVVGFYNDPKVHLSDKLISSLYSAKIIGADKRCSTYNTSSLSAYIVVANPNDNINKPFIRLENGVGKLNVDPIDTLVKSYLALNIKRTNYKSVICTGDTFVASIPSVFKSVEWKWNNSSLKGNEIVLTGLQAGNYSFDVDYTFLDQRITEKVSFKVSSGGEIEYTSDTAGCEGDYIFIQPSKSNAKTILWSDGWKGKQRVIQVGDDTVFIIQATDVYGCLGEPDTLNVKCNKPSSGLSKDTLLICMNQPFKENLNAIGNQPFEYFNNQLNQQITKIEGLTSADESVEVRIIDVNGCESIDTFHVLVDSVSVFLNFTDSTICYTDSIAVIGFAQFREERTEKLFWGEKFGHSNYRSLGVGQYMSYAVSPAGCVDSQAVNIQDINEKLDFLKDTTLCEGSKIKIESPFIVRWDNGYTVLHRTFTIADSNEIHYVRNFSHLGCKGQWDSIRFYSLPAPKASFDYVFDSDSVNFQNTSIKSDSFHWDFGDGSTSALKDPTHGFEFKNRNIVTLSAFNKTCPQHDYIDTISVNDFHDVGVDSLMEIKRGSRLNISNTISPKLSLTNHGKLTSDVFLYYQIAQLKTNAVVYSHSKTIPLEVNSQKFVELESFNFNTTGQYIFAVFAKSEGDIIETNDTMFTPFYVDNIGSIVYEENRVLEIFPNPGSGNFTLRINSLKSDEVISIYNNMGAMIDQISTTEQLTNIDLSRFPSGVYIAYYQGLRIKLVKTN